MTTLNPYVQGRQGRTAAALDRLAGAFVNAGRAIPRDEAAVRSAKHGSAATSKAGTHLRVERSMDCSLILFVFLVGVPLILALSVAGALVTGLMLGAN